MGTITDWLSGLSGAAVYAVVGGLVFCEDALFFGFVIPGESAAVIGGVLAAQHQVSVYWLAVVVVAAAIAGDSVGYEIGRRFGPRLLAARSLRRHRGSIESARDLIRRRGPVAVFLGRFVAFFRAVIAGARRCLGHALPHLPPVQRAGRPRLGRRLHPHRLRRSATRTAASSTSSAGAPPWCSWGWSSSCWWSDTSGGAAGAARRVRTAAATARPRSRGPAATDSTDGSDHGE